MARRCGSVPISWMRARVAAMKDGISIREAAKALGMRSKVERLRAETASQSETPGEPYRLFALDLGHSLSCRSE